MELRKNQNTKMLSILLCGALLVAGAVYLILNRSLTATEAELAQLRTESADTLREREERITQLETLLNETKEVLEKTMEERDELDEDLDEEKERNDAFEDQIEKIGSTVGVLDKLSKTDPELLQKYSKVYFLNEHYVPEKLVEIPKAELYDESVPKFIHGKVAPFLSEMIEDALEDGIKLWVRSAYRSFETQGELKGAYTVSYGSGANAFSADQGYSEHQLGTTLDFTTQGIQGGLDGFENTPAYTWLLANAYKYGFTLSYPPNNTYYVFEPWHWRFVGTDLAKDLHTKGKFFYDLDQREIDKYLVSIFD